MVFKKKVMVSTVAASLAFSVFAGLPLSNKGLLDKLGVQTAQAAGLADINSRLSSIHEYLYTEDEKQAIRDARGKLQALKGDSSKVGLVASIAGKIDDNNLSDLAILNLFSSLGLFYNTDGSELTAALTDPEIRVTLGQLAQLGGSSMGDLTVQDAADYAVGLENALKDQLKEKSLLQLAGLATDETAMKQLIKAAIASVMNNTTQYKFSAILNKIGINVDDVTDVTTKLVNEVDPTRIGATYIALAILREDANKNFNLVSGSGTHTQKFSVTILGKTVPNILAWTSSNTGVTVTGEGSTGYLVATFSGSSTTTTVEGRIVALGTNLDGKLLIQRKDLPLTYTAPSENPAPGPIGGPVGAPGPTTPEPVTKAIENITNLKKEFENASQEKKAEILEQVLNKLNEALNQIATVDLSSKIKVTGDKAVPQLDTADLIKSIKSIAENAKKMSDSLKELDPNAKASLPALTLNLGNVTAKSLEVPLAKELLAALKDNGLAGVNVKLNGAAVVIPTALLNGDTKLNVNKQDKSVAEKATNKPVASDIIDVNLTSGGSVLTGFNQPITLSLTVQEPGKFDQELLTMVLIDGEKIVNFGGKFNKATNQVSTLRDHFSTYAVIENKVAFKDTASVSSWAGRQIEVAAAKGIVEGRADGQFVPDGTITRAEFAKMIVGTFGLSNAAATESFDDVSDQDWFKPYVASAVKNGLVNGRAEGKFDPNGTITRAEMATIAARALTAVKGAKAPADVQASLKNFTDVASVHESLKAGIALSAAQGIVIGEEGGKFNPNAESTRAQAAVLIYRLLNK